MRVKGPNGLIFDVVNTVATGLISAGYVEQADGEPAEVTSEDLSLNDPDPNPEASDGDEDGKRTPKGKTSS